MRALSMSVLLAENTPNNGPLMLIPGSHKAYLTCIGETPEEHYRQSLKRQEYGVPDEDSLAELAHKHGIVAPTGKPGSVVIFDCNTMHGSNGNITPFPRANAFMVYNAVSNRLAAPFGVDKPRPEFIAARLSDPDTVLLPVWRGRNLVDESGDTPRAGGFSVAEGGMLLEEGGGTVFHGDADGRAYIAVDVSSHEEPSEVAHFAEFGEFRNLRDVGAAMSQAEGALLAFGRGVFAWHETHGFCSRCGGKTEICDGGHRRKCTNCGASHYPRVAPAVIMLVRSGDKVLLGHN